MFELIGRFIWESIPIKIKILSGLLLLEWITLFLICGKGERTGMVVAGIGMLPMFLIVVFMSMGENYKGGKLEAKGD